MRTALVLAAALVARTALAQPASEPQQPTAPTVPTTQIPLPATETQPTPPASPTPPPAATDTPAPKADPAYGEAKGDTGEPGEARPSRHTVVIRYIPERSRNNVILLAALGGAAVAFGAGGLYYHQQSRTSADEVSADTYTGKAWTAERQDAYDSSHRDARVAEVLYGIGGALALATAITYIVTEPEMTETMVSPRVAPTRGGAMVGAGWRF